MSFLASECEFMNLAEICRSCMSKKQKMRPLFGSSLDSMLMSVANVKVSPNDGFPAQMCVQCVLQVSRSFTFKQQCEKSDATIREHLAKQNKEKSALNELAQESDEPEPELQLITLHPDNPGLEYRINGNSGNECVLILRSVKVPPVPVVQQPEIVVEEEPTSFIVSNVDSFLKNEEQQVVQESQVQPIEIVDEGKVIDFEINRNDLSCNLGQELLEDGCYEIEESFEPNQEDVILENESPDQNIFADVADQLPDTEVPVPGTDELLNARFECNVCKKKFSNSSKLRRHSRTHLLNKPHVCNICGMGFAESSNLTKHNRKHTGALRNVVGKPNLCSVCGKRFKWTTSLSKHMKLHTKRKLFWCSFPGCGKYYVEQRSLNIHSYSHGGKKPFTCQYCNKEFTQKCNLDKHERTHTRNESSKQFSNALTVHECGKRFSRQETLTIHKARKHSDERPPHGCVLCEERFESGAELTEHMKSAHGDRFYHMCPSCGKVYASMQSLKNHQKIHLKEGDEELKLTRSCGLEQQSRETDDSNLPVDQILVNFTSEDVDAIYE